MAATPFDLEDHNGSQSVDFWLKYVEESESWTKVEKRKKVKKSEDDSFFVLCTQAGKGLIDHPIIGGASGTLGSSIIIGYNLLPQVGTGLTGLQKSGTPSFAIPDPESLDRSILPNQLNLGSLVNQGLDLQWTRSVTHPDPDKIYQPSGKPVYPHRLPLYESKSTLLNQDKKPWNTLVPSQNEPWVIII